VARGGDRAQAEVLLAVAGLDDVGPEPPRPVGVIAVAMGEQDDPDAAALPRSRTNRVEMGLDVRPRVDHSARPRSI
jgi:hypothetical protein